MQLCALFVVQTWYIMVFLVEGFPIQVFKKKHVILTLHSNLQNQHIHMELLVSLASLLTQGQELRREGWTEKRSAVRFCLGSGLFGSYNSD